MAKNALKAGEWSFIFAIIIGLAIGILIKKIKYGLLFGAIIGGLLFISSWIRFTRK